MGRPACTDLDWAGGIFVDQVEGGKVPEHRGVSDMVGLAQATGSHTLLGLAPAQARAPRTTF
jgi:hypothetical protein